MAELKLNLKENLNLSMKEPKVYSKEKFILFITNNNISKEYEFLNFFNKEKFQVIFATNNQDNLIKKIENVKFFPVDITNKEKVEKLIYLIKPEYVIYGQK
jgi:dTDP-4-dehydrorhamnose reductase